MRIIIITCKCHSYLLNSCKCLSFIRDIRRVHDYECAWYIPHEVLNVSECVLRLVVTHHEEGGLLVGVGGTAPPALLAQALGILHGQ